MESTVARGSTSEAKRSTRTRASEPAGAQAILEGQASILELGRVQLRQRAADKPAQHVPNDERAHTTVRFAERDNTPDPDGSKDGPRDLRARASLSAA